MKNKIITSALLFSCTLFLHACLNSSNDVAEGGIGGSGITAGRINAFGSIIVNGIEFDTSTAILIRDNATVSNQSAYAVGEVVTISGTINTETRQGIADTVEFSSLIEGPVSAKPPLLSTSLEVLGQTIHIDDLTILHDFSFISDLNPADIVEISGLTDANGTIQASSITLKSEPVSAFEIKGTVSSLDIATQTFTFNNNLTINYSNANITTVNGQLANGQRTTVIGQIIFNNTLFATQITEKTATELASGTKMELEGIITRFNSADDFDLNNQPVITTATTLFKDGARAELKLNASVEVEGSINDDGVLVIRELELQQVEHLPQIEALIESIDYQNHTLVVLGHTIKLNQATIFFDESTQKVAELNINQLTIGEYVDVKFTIQNDGSFLAVRLSREDKETVTGTNVTQISFKGTVQNINETESSFTLYGMQMTSDENTTYLDDQENPIGKAALFAAIQAGVTLVEVEGEAAGNNSVIMHSILVDIPLGGSD